MAAWSLMPSCHNGAPQNNIKLQVQFVIEEEMASTVHTWPLGEAEACPNSWAALSVKNPISSYGLRPERCQGQREQNFRRPRPRGQNRLRP